jgi:citrate synthase
MVAGAAIEERFAQALDAYITTVIDNGLSASTFAARVIISTRASLASAVVGAYGAFTGALHGGAPGLALDLLDDIAKERRRCRGDPERKLAAGERLMGFGHRVFRLRDPRADMLRAALLRLDPEQSPPRLRQGGRAPAPSRRSSAASPAAVWKPISRWTPRCCSMPSGCHAAAFTPVFAMARRRPGSRMRWSSVVPAA